MFDVFGDLERMFAESRIPNVTIFMSFREQIVEFARKLEDHPVLGGKYEQDYIRELENNLMNAYMCLNSLIDMMEKRNV